MTRALWGMPGWDVQATGSVQGKGVSKSPETPESSVDGAEGTPRGMRQCGRA